MYPILETKKLTANIYWMEVKAERIAKSCMPGQFVIVRTDADSERIPLTICDYNREKGTITIVFQPVGASTHLMTSLKAGDAFHDVAGPLGCPSELTKETKEALAAKNLQKLNWRTSIVDLMKLLGMDSSLANRKELAKELGCPENLIGGDYSQMNVWLIKAVMKKLAENGGKVPEELK